jgi:16S rRNA (adenine1518-N6/adenine1519-N6)-dimethyltransferase
VKHIRPHRSLGQSFLTYEPVADNLVDSLGAGPGDTVLEIGSGKGMLTRRLLARAGHVLAVEVDPRLVEGLREELGADRKLEVVRSDFMVFDLSGLRGLLVMGNLPYNLSSQMLLRLLEYLPSWDAAVLTTQREFAHRLLAGPGTKAYGALSVLFDRLVERERLFNIEARCFKPRPDVVSTAFRLRRRPQPLYDVADPEQFRRVVRACFAQRRKTIANNIAAAFGLNRPTVECLLGRAGIEPAVRAEMLPGDSFRRLAYEMAGELSAGRE